MRLLAKNTLILLGVTVTVFSIGGLIFYSQLKNIMQEEASEALYIKKGEIEAYVLRNKKLPESISMEELTLAETIAPVAESVKDIQIYSEEEKEYLPYKRLTFNLMFAEKNYHCTISKSLFEVDDLIETILWSFTIIVILLIAIFVIINFLFSLIIWKPFFTTLQQINEYEIEKHQVIEEEMIGTKEFQQLNIAVSRMTKKISNDFNNLKSFTENASHELQTPLAVIKNKTEVLLQTEGLSDDQAKEIIGINQTVSRLSKLNQTLLLLSKIENHQFGTADDIDFSQIINNKILQFEEAIAMKNISVHSSLAKVNVMIHPMLADIIVSNLVSNAIRYTPEKGNIILELNNSFFKICNEGAPLKAKNQELFSRFYKEHEDSTSTGLGLALVKQIALINNHDINYAYINSSHIFTYFFKN